MKKITILTTVFVCISFMSFAKELDGKDLEAVHSVLDAKLNVGKYEELQEQLDYLDIVEKQIGALGDSISDEAKLICKGILITQKETSKTEYQTKLEESQKKKSNKKEKDPEKEAVVMNLYNEYKTFADTHSDLSSHFYLHYKEAELSTLAFISLSRQIEIFKNIVKAYKDISEINNNYSEGLYNYAMMLYNAPKMAGGDKDLAREKALKAIEVSQSKYEKVTALVVYSQILIQEKQKEEGEKYFLEAIKLDPENKGYDRIREMNEAGYSMFQDEEYKKKKK